MNGLPVDRQTFIGADDATYRGLEYDILSELYRRIAATHARLDAQPGICDNKYVTVQWVGERKNRLVALLFGVCVGGGVSGAWLMKLLTLF